MNQTASSPLFDDLVIRYRTSTPFYHSQTSQLVDGIPDHYLTLAAPIIAYWSLSFLFHWFDISDWKWLEKYRIHESNEVKSRNLATKPQVIWAVLFQQLIQTVLGLVLLSDESHKVVNHGFEMERIARAGWPFLSFIFGEKWSPRILGDASYFIYWWGIPALQLMFAMFIIDTWQYFLHRAMHVNKFLYRHFHSWHHRLHVPYAFGALYNHPVEGFLLDSLGAGLAELLTSMSTRQAMLLFSLSTFKTVDDHCGYRLPLDPLQLITVNNADYHDIHHQTIGIKSNFSQPFFIHWDVLLGTRMTRQELESRTKKGMAKTE